MWKGKPLRAVPAAGKLVLTQQDWDPRAGCWDTAIRSALHTSLKVSGADSTAFPLKVFPGHARVPCSEEGCCEMKADFRIIVCCLAKRKFAEGCSPGPCLLPPAVSARRGAGLSEGKHWQLSGCWQS